eukprot:187489-Rhodomonas_salina.1
MRTAVPCFALRGREVRFGFSFLFFFFFFLYLAAAAAAAEPRSAAVASPTDTSDKRRENVNIGAKCARMVARYAVRGWGVVPAAAAAAEQGAPGGWLAPYAVSVLLAA